MTCVHFADVRESEVGDDELGSLVPLAAAASRALVKSQG